MPGGDLVPTGYEEIFSWVIRRGRWRRCRPLVLRGVAAAIMLMLVGLASSTWRWLQRSEAIAILNNTQLSVVDRLERTQDFSDTPVLQRRAKVFAEELESLSGSLKLAKSEAAAEEMSRKAESLDKLRPGAMQSRLDSLKRACHQKQADILYRKTDDAFQGRIPDFPGLSSRFLRDFSDDSRSDGVREMVRKLRNREESEARASLKQIRVTGSPDLAMKGQRIVEFVNKYQDMLDSGEKTRMKRAAEFDFCQS